MFPGPHQDVLRLLLFLFCRLFEGRPRHLLAWVRWQLGSDCVLTGSGSIQTVTGGQCVNVLVNAMSPSFRNYPNSLPESADITSAAMICYFVYFCLQIPFLMIP
jgi:hypothetical protein